MKGKTIAKATSASLAELDHNLDNKGHLRSHEVVFSLSNAIAGPNLILLPLLFMPTGILTATIMALFFGYVEYKTCYLTVMQVKPNEPEYLFAIRRILGKPFMYLYFGIVIADLWLVCIIFYIALANTLFAGINNIVEYAGYSSLPPTDQIVFNEFSIQWLSIILAVILLACISFKDISKIVSLSSKGEIGIIVALLYLIYVGFKAIIQGNVNITFDTAYSQSSLPLFSTDFKSMIELVGFYAAAYLLHFLAVPILRTGNDPAKKPRNLLWSYIFTGIIYIVAGVFGAFGFYYRSSNSDQVQTIFDIDTSKEKDVFIFSIITQVAVAFQLVTVIPVSNFVAKDQLFSLIWREDENDPAPNWAFHGWNIVFIICLLGCQILNLSPNDLMTYVGTFGGFIIVYLVPCLLHLKSRDIYQKAIQVSETQESLIGENSSGLIVSSLHKEEAMFSSFTIKTFYYSIIGLGVALVAAKVYGLIEPN